MTFKTIRDIDVRGKKILLRGDLNVPAKGGIVSDTTRIDRLKPTIDYLATHGAKIILLSHFGRPKDGPDPEFSMAFLPPILQKSWGRPVSFADDCIGDSVGIAIDRLNHGDILLLENVRFHPGEEKNDPAFIKALAGHGDIFVNDAFASAHRAHASTEGLAHVLPAVAGLLMEAELNALSAALDTPTRPMAAIIGGAKISTKLDLIFNLIEKSDMIILGGGMANTFLHAQGVDMKSSLCEHDMADQARAILQKAKDRGCDILLPLDGIWASAFAAGTDHGTCAMTAIPDGKMVLDIGPQTIAMLKQRLGFAKTIIWNGPLGAFEISPFENGTVELAKFIAAQTRAGAMISVAGGGDTVAALEKSGLAGNMTYLSTAGGAFLEWMEGKTLPGVAALASLGARPRSSAG